jgi:hypothetical protein
LFALVSRVFVPYIRFITVTKHQKSVFFNKNCKYLRPTSAFRGKQTGKICEVMF